MALYSFLFFPPEKVGPLPLKGTNTQHSGPMCENGFFFHWPGLVNVNFTGPGQFFTGLTIFSLASGPGPAAKVADWWPYGSTISKLNLIVVEIYSKSLVRAIG